MHDGKEGKLLRISTAGWGLGSREFIFLGRAPLRLEEKV